MDKEQLKEKVIQFLVKEEILNDYEIGQDILEEDLEAHGLDSFSFVKMLVAIEQTFNVEIPNDFLKYEKWGTINNIVESLFRIIVSN